MSDRFETLISVDQLVAHIEDPQFVVIDCRFSLANTEQGQAHFNESRIPTARYAHLDKHLSSPIIPGISGRHPLPEKDTLAIQFQHWGINNDSQIIAYDDKSGAIASRLWWLSRWLGHSACAVINGGFSQWKKSDKPIETTAPTTPSKGNFTSRQPLVHYVEKDQVLDPNHYLIDAREPERYRGEHEPIDPVAGHIPGASNLPFIENLDADGKFLEPQLLAKRFDSAIAQAGKKELVHYCGSGVTAAHNMLAMAYARREPGAMYAGSFSEWIAKPTHDEASESNANATNKNAEQYPVARQDG